MGGWNLVKHGHAPAPVAYGHDLYTSNKLYAC